MDYICDTDGCTERFKTLREVEEHRHDRHGKRKVKEIEEVIGDFLCPECLAKGHSYHFPTELSRDKHREKGIHYGLLDDMSKSEHPAVPLLDDINHPSHYTQYKGIEVIDLTEQMNFNRGNAVKYIARAGFKGGPTDEVKDLQKAKWYITREIERLQSS